MWEYKVAIFPVGPGSPDADIDIRDFLNKNGRQGYRLIKMENYEGDFVLVMERELKE